MLKNVLVDYLIKVGVGELFEPSVKTGQTEAREKMRATKFFRLYTKLRNARVRKQA